MSGLTPQPFTVYTLQPPLQLQQTFSSAFKPCTSAATRANVFTAISMLSLLICELTLQLLHSVSGASTSNDSSTAFIFSHLSCQRAAKSKTPRAFSDGTSKDTSNPFSAFDFSCKSLYLYCNSRSAFQTQTIYNVGPLLVFAPVIFSISERSLICVEFLFGIVHVSYVHRTNTLNIRDEIR